MSSVTEKETENISSFLPSSLTYFINNKLNDVESKINCTGEKKPRT